MGLKMLVLPLALAGLVVLVVYYVFLVRAILEMLERDADRVLLVFAFAGLLPLPPTVVSGILVIIIWHTHKKTLPSSQPPQD